jgi:hypothetical protein
MAVRASRRSYWPRWRSGITLAWSIYAGVTSRRWIQLSPTHAPSSKKSPGRGVALPSANASDARCACWRL